MKIVNKFVLTLFCLAFTLVLLNLQVQAAEQVMDDEPFTYSVEGAFTYYEDRSNNRVIFCRRDVSYSFESVYPLAGYVADISLNQYGYIICSANGQYFNYDYTAPLYYDGELHITSTGTGPSKKVLLGTNLQPNQRDFVLLSMSTDIPLFRSESDMEHYFETGDDSGCINLFNPDTSGAKSADFSLADVKFWKDDLYFYATWSGLTEYFENEDVSNDFISVSAGFYNSGISVTKSIGCFYLKDNSLKIPLSKLVNYENDELSMIKLVPYHYAGSGNSELYIGKSSTTYFNDLFYDDEWGTYYDSECFIVNPKMSYTKGTSALSGTLSTFMGKELSNGMYSYSSRNMNYTFLWESVNTSIEADLSLSHMRIDIVCDNREYVFSNSGHLLSSGSIEISLQEILSLLQDNGVKPVIESFSIKYTPYYTIGRKTYHGQSVRFIVQANSAGILQISQGDDSFNEDSDYSDVDIVPPDDLPIEIPGFTDDESFEFDFIYDSDNMFKNFFNSLKSLISYCGQIPFLVNKVFSFLPSIYGNMIVVILAACFVMRLLGR